MDNMASIVKGNFLANFLGNGMNHKNPYIKVFFSLLMVFGLTSPREIFNYLGSFNLKRLIQWKQVYIEFQSEQANTYEDIHIRCSEEMRAIFHYMDKEKINLYKKKRMKNDVSAMQIPIGQFQLSTKENHPIIPTGKLWLTNRIYVMIYISEKNTESKRHGNKMIHQIQLFLYDSRGDLNFLHEFLNTLVKEYQKYSRSYDPEDLKVYTVVDVDVDGVYGVSRNLKTNHIKDTYYPSEIQKIIQTSEPMNILAYGEPGTGKTKMATAIAGKQKKDIIEVDLSVIENSADLYRLFNLKGMYVNGVLVKINPENVIFLIEEIDRRNPTLVMKKEIWETMKNKKDTNLEELSKQINGQIKEKTNHIDIDNLGTMVQNVEKTQSTINIGDLLTVLDGVTPLDMTVFITTNHIELLDKALTRAGRVYKVKLTYLTKEQIQVILCDMFHVSLQTLQQYTIQENKYTISEVCELCKHSQNLNECIEKLNKNIR